MLAIGMPGLTEWFIILFLTGIPVVCIVIIVRALRRSRNAAQRGFEVKSEQDRPA